MPKTLIATYELPMELDTGYTLTVLVAARGPDEARESLFRILGQMGWRPGKAFVLGTPVEVEVLPITPEPTAAQFEANPTTINQ